MNNSRRGFFKAGLMAIGFYPLLKISDAAAKAACVLAEKCPQPMPTDAKTKKKFFDLSNAKNKKKANSLSYVETGAEAATKKAAGDKKFAKYDKGENCSNCTHYKKPTGENYGRCAMVGNKYVPSCAWCKTYVKNKKCA